MCMYVYVYICLGVLCRQNMHYSKNTLCILGGYGYKNWTFANILCVFFYWIRIYGFDYIIMTIMCISSMLISDYVP